jgi:hypothetical protein
MYVAFYTDSREIVKIDRIGFLGMRWIRICRIRQYALVPMIFLGILTTFALARPAHAATTSRVVLAGIAYQVSMHQDGSVHWAQHIDLVAIGNPAPLTLRFLILKPDKTTLKIDPIPGALDQHNTHVERYGYSAEQIAWTYRGRSNTPFSFDISYTLQNAIMIGQDEAWLDWHFLLHVFGGVDESNVNTGITLQLAAPIPPAAMQTSTYFPRMQPTITTIDGHTMHIEADHLDLSSTDDTQTTLEAEVIIPRNVLSASLKPLPWTVSRTPPTVPTPFHISLNPAIADNIWYWALGILSGLFVLFIAIVWPWQDAYLKHTKTLTGAAMNYNLIARAFPVIFIKKHPSTNRAEIAARRTRPKRHKPHHIVTP